MNSTRLVDPSLAKLLSLTGKAAIITGGGRGIGRAIAQRLAEAGAAVLVTDIVGAQASETAALIAEAGGKAISLECDAASVPDAARVVEAANEAFGRVDVLVNNAAIFPATQVMDITEAQWDRMLDVNLKGLFFYAQAAARRMIQGGSGGAIINIASINALRPNVGMAHYDASKGGVVALTRSLAKELGRHQIRVNAIAPGITTTPGLAKEIAGMMTAAGAPDDTPLPVGGVLGRNGNGDDIARAAVFLAGGLSDFMTGALLMVDGGHLLL